jgi:hypothetical protein
MLAAGGITASSGTGAAGSATGSATGAAAGTGLGAGTAGTTGMGRVTQPASHTLPTMTTPTHHTPSMLLLLLEALFAGLLFVGIIWWTMFSGRKGGELPRQDEEEQSDRKP